MNINQKKTTTTTKYFDFDLCLLANGDSIDVVLLFMYSCLFFYDQIIKLGNLVIWTAIKIEYR